MTVTEHNQRLVRTFTTTTIRGSNLTTVYLENGSVGLALAFPGDGLPWIVHWGRPLADPQSASNLYDALAPQNVSGNLDGTLFPSIIPTQAESWSGRSRFVVCRPGGELFCRFSVTSLTADQEGKLVDPLSPLATQLTSYKPSQLEQAMKSSPTYPRQENVPHVIVQAEDAEQGVCLYWELQLLDSGLVRQRVKVVNSQSDLLSVQTVELGYNLPSVVSEVLTTTGHHLRERSPQRQELVKGRLEKNSLMGRPDFDATLLMNIGTRGFGFEQGEIYSVHVGCSGNSTVSVEAIPFASPVLGGGELLFGGEADLGESEGYTSPWVYGSYGHGLNQVSHRFHDLLRQLHPNLAAKPRPVILNTWEAVYFQHSFPTLRSLADKAADCGVERFVVDDGWFGSRRSEHSGLGDWQVSSEVWPQGLKPLADYVHNKNMEFGLWFEPEMINLDSDTARAHPDWILSPTVHRPAVQGRYQQVIDLTNPEVLDYVFSAMDSLVEQIGIDYIKWDHNKLVSEPVSRLTGLPAVHRQTEAVYAIIDALKLRHPGLEIESCSSGGGRVDMGILTRCDSIWVSDCVDPVERATIQPYTSLLVAPEMMGEHIGDSPAHSTARVTSLPLRAAMSLLGHLGVEWNLNTVSQDQLDQLRDWIAVYKQSRLLVADGQAQLVHADSPDPSIRLDGLISADKTQALFRFTQVTTSVNYPAAPIRLPGLDPQALYRICPLPVSQDLSQIGNGQTPLSWWSQQGLTVNGEALQTYGVRPPQLHPAQAVVFSARKV